MLLARLASFAGSKSSPVGNFSPNTAARCLSGFFAFLTVAVSATPPQCAFEPFVLITIPGEPGSAPAANGCDDRTVARRSASAAAAKPIEARTSARAARRRDMRGRLHRPPAVVHALLDDDE